MRYAIAALAACFVTSAVPQDVFLTGEALQAETAKSCAEGCVTFSRQEAENFQAQLNKVLRQKQEEAFEAGRRDAKERCASLI